MANDNKQNVIIRKLPNWTVFRKLASRIKIKITYKYALPNTDVRQGEYSEQEKNAVVWKCRHKWEDEYKRVNAMIDETFRTIPYYSQNDVDLSWIREDMVFAYFAYGFFPGEYFAFGLENKRPKERREFISGRLRMRFRCQMNNLLQAHYFNDKTETYELYKEDYHREAVAVEKPADYRKFHDFVSRHPVFVKKQVYLAQGDSVALVDINKITGTEQEFFESLIKVGKHILEEKIVQSEEMAVFNESSVNTVRAITFNTKSGLKVPYCMVRTGRKGTFVDNSGAGGIQAEIDFATGKVISDGYDELGGKFKAHPSTGTVFKGYQMPDWNGLQELIFRSAKKMPQIQFIGWDLAYTEEGWIIVEGNENCYTVALQQIRDKGMRSIFEELMKEMELYA